MELELTPIEVRVLGCLIEKEIATPDHYPLTLNALVNACNQKSNRQPLMQLDQNAVMRALDELRMTHQLAIEVTSNSSRVPKYKHNFRAKWNFSSAKTAILCELFLRGPQTSGDLRAHTSRLHPLADWHEVEEILHGLENCDGNAFVVHLPREPGLRERRWTHLLSGEPEPAIEPELSLEGTTGDNDRITALEAEVATLHKEFDELKTNFTEFKTAFE